MSRPNTVSKQYKPSRSSQDDRSSGNLLNHRRVMDLPTASLTPGKGHARLHSREQIQRVADSIRRFGFLNPILIDDGNEIVAGHGRWEAAKHMGLETVPTLRASFLSEADKRAYRLADNRLAELAGWDDDLLRIEFEFLIDADFDPIITGFDTVDIDALLVGDISRSDPADALDADTDRERPAVPRLGDVWLLGDHRVLCGDARDPDAYAVLLGDEQAQLVVTDPPYNVKIDGHVCGLGSVQHRSFAMAAGEMSEEEFTRFLAEVFGNLATVSSDGAIQFIFMDWRHLGELLAAAKSNYDEIKNLIVWVKTNAGMGSFYRSQHEMILAAKVGTAPHINNFKLGSKRYRTNVWTYPGVNTFRKDRMSDLKDHPTVKPVAMISDAILDCSKPGGIVLDPFLGSGTTILAAERTGRRGRGLELDPAYVDVIIRRWEEMTGETAVHERSGMSFATRAARPRTRPRPVSPNLRSDIRKEAV